LVLTPEGGCADPDQARDDGIVNASQIARLSLDADWVILSGCNTAAGASLTAAPLTGLARAFLYAGARRLLVSHWAVDSAAAADLVTATVAGAGSWDTRLADAMSTMRQSQGALAYRAHPAFWAPFVIVGEGR
jgi:CHAT domain-containing protein